MTEMSASMSLLYHCCICIFPLVTATGGTIQPPQLYSTQGTTPHTSLLLQLLALQKIQSALVTQKYSQHMSQKIQSAHVTKNTVSTCHTRIQSAHVIHDYSQHMLYKITVSTCYTRLQSEHVIEEYSQHMLYKNTVSTCCTIIQSAHVIQEYSQQVSYQNWSACVIK